MELYLIEQQLEQLPDKIRTQAIDTALKNKLVDEKKLSYDISYGMAISTLQANNATEKKALAVNSSKKQSLDLIEAKYNYEISKAELNYLDNSYISARKLASLEGERLKSNISGF